MNFSKMPLNAVLVQLNEKGRHTSITSVKKMHSAMPVRGLKL